MFSAGAAGGGAGQRHRGQLSPCPPSGAAHVCAALLTINLDLRNMRTLLHWQQLSIFYYLFISALTLTTPATQIKNNKMPAKDRKAPEGTLTFTLINTT